MVPLFSFHNTKSSNNSIQENATKARSDKIFNWQDTEYKQTCFQFKKVITTEGALRLITIQSLSNHYPITIQSLSNDYPMTNDYHQLLIYFSWWSWDRRWLFKSSATFILKDLSTEILAILANFSYFWGKFTHIFGVPFRGCGLPKLTNIRCGQDAIFDWDLK